MAHNTNVDAWNAEMNEKNQRIAEILQTLQTIPHLMQELKTHGDRLVVLSNLVSQATAQTALRLVTVTQDYDVLEESVRVAEQRAVRGESSLRAMYDAIMPIKRQRKSSS